MTEATRLVLIRHGQTASNGADPNPVMSGWADLPLSPTGWRQARALGQHFLGSRDVDGVYCSPLQRAHATARQIHQENWAPLRCLEALREIHCGQVDGLPITEVRHRYMACWEENMRQDNPDFRWPGGESYRELRERSLAALDRIAREHPGQRILIVTHCGLISQVIGWLHGLSPAQWEKFRPGNGSLTELDWGPSGPRLVNFDDRRHLRLLPQPEMAASLSG